MTTPLKRSNSKPRLIAFSGLPGVGKSTIARELALVLSAAYLEIDACEAALMRSALAPVDVMDAGYRVLWGIAEGNLKLGLDVVADSVNPVTRTRNGWRNVAHVTGATLIEVEVLCSDKDRHRTRVEARLESDPTLPDWDAVTARHYIPRTEPRIVLETAERSPEDCVADLLERI